MSDLISIEINDGIADVRLNRPEKYNALSPEMFSAIVAAGESLANNDDLRVVVLSGNGPGFCAGLDMGSFQGMQNTDQKSSDSSLQDFSEGPANRAQKPAYA